MKKKLEEIAETVLEPIKQAIGEHGYGQKEIEAIVEKKVADIVKSLVKKEVAELAVRAGLEAAKRGLI